MSNPRDRKTHFSPKSKVEIKDWVALCLPSLAYFIGVVSDVVPGQLYIYNNKKKVS